MSDKIDKIFGWYLIIVSILLLLIVIGAFIAGPLILALLVSPYYLLLNIASLFLAPAIIMSFVMFIMEIIEDYL